MTLRRGRSYDRRAGTPSHTNRGWGGRPPHQRDGRGLWAVAMDEGRGCVAADEAAGEGGDREAAAAADKFTETPRGDVVSMEEDVVADLTATGEGVPQLWRRPRDGRRALRLLG